MVVPIVSILCNRLKGLVLWILSVVRRAFCCFRRRRRPSVDSVPLLEIGIVPSHNPPTYGELQSWNTWEEDSPDSVVTDQRPQPNSIQDHIDMYRQQKLASTLGLNSNGKEEDPDYFQDMVPKLTKQKRLLLKKPDVEDINAANARLKMDVQASGLGGDELKEWEESSGWDDEVRDCDQDADLILREQKRLERERRAAEKLQKRLEKQSRPVPLGARLS